MCRVQCFDLLKQETEVVLCSHNAETKQVRYIFHSNFSPRRLKFHNKDSLSYLPYEHNLLL